MPENNGKSPPENKVRILLVDDDQIILDSLGGFLELEGYDVTKAETIAQAINCLQAGRYNLVITDVSMPASDGFELLRYVKTHHGDIVVIMVTGYGTIESAVDAIKQGAYDYLTKPISTATFAWLCRGRFSSSSYWPRIASSGRRCQTAACSATSSARISAC